MVNSMKKHIVPRVVIAVVMFGLPWAAVTFAPGDAGMAIMFVLLFGFNSAESMFAGIYAGLAPKQRFYLPFVNAVIFLLGVWSVFDWGNPDFYGYAIAYLAIGFVSMLTTIVVVRNIRRNM